jgi:hypothetical protein
MKRTSIAKACTWVLPAVLVLAVAAGFTRAAGAQAPPAAEPVAQSAEYAQVRAKFENMTPDQIAAAGYVAAEPVPTCISSPAGGMGYHYINPRHWAGQFESGQMDPLNPPLILLNEKQQVIGLEWEASKNIQPAPVLFGQPALLLQGHPGVPDDHYMLHSYFKPNGMVLFSEFDPELICPGSANVVAAEPVGMPRTGASDVAATLAAVFVALAMIALAMIALAVDAAARRATR